MSSDKNYRNAWNSENEANQMLDRIRICFFYFLRGKFRSKNSRYCGHWFSENDFQRLICNVYFPGRNQKFLLFGQPVIVFAEDFRCNWNKIIQISHFLE